MCDHPVCPTPDECSNCLRDLGLCRWDCERCLGDVIGCRSCARCLQNIDDNEELEMAIATSADVAMDRYGLCPPATSLTLSSGINTIVGTGTAAWAGGWVKYELYELEGIAGMLADHDKAA